MRLFSLASLPLIYSHIPNEARLPPFSQFCPKNCDSARRMLDVCGSNGKTYDSLCHLRNGMKSKLPKKKQEQYKTLSIPGKDSTVASTKPMLFSIISARAKQAVQTVFKSCCLRRFPSMSQIQHFGIGKP